MQQQQDDGGDSEPMDTSTKDPSGISYNRSTLQSEELKSLFDKVGVFSGLSILNPSLNIARSVMGKGNVAAASNAALGGIIDGFRGGDVNYFGTNQRNTGLQSGTYNDNRSLNDVSKFDQNEIAAIGSVVFSSVIDPMIYDIKDGKNVARSDSDIRKEAIFAAERLGIRTTIPGTNIAVRTETILRAVAKEEYKIRQVEREKQIEQALGEVTQDVSIKEAVDRQARAEAAARRQVDKAAGQPFTSAPDYSSGDSGDDGFGSGQETSYGQDTSGYTDTSTGLGVGAKGGFFTKSKMTKQKPKKMKRGGLASR